jgi:hypothetical protein
VRFELGVGGDTCGPRGGFASLEGTWKATTAGAVEAMRRRGRTGPLVVVTDGGTRSVAVVDALRASGEVFTEVPAGQLATAAGTVPLDSLVLVATDRADAWAAVDTLGQATGAVVPVVLAPWLLDASVLSEIAGHGMSALAATYRAPTSEEAVTYRVGASLSPGGGWAITAAWFEAFVASLERLTRATAAPAVRGVYSAARVAVLPSELDHPSESGWSAGVAMIRVA